VRPLTAPRRRTVGNPKGERAHDVISAEVILDTAARLIERDGVDAFTMRGLAEQLGVAVTSIYWHVGGRDKLFDNLVDRLLSQMAHLPVAGDTAVDRIASLARSQRTALIERQHLLAIAHERDRTPRLFLPIQQTLAAQLADLGVTGTDAALFLRAVQVHVISSALMQFSAVRVPDHDEEDPSLWADDWPDVALVEALQSPTDYDAVFEYGLNALLAPLRTAHADYPKDTSAFTARA
jgi:TetR/AcrR family transcriptional regulator, tetracycline repressor protein